ncbi:hypothetical protein [Roseicitreum antarcticum]|uniref:hypothetical protein n=1 Tax=Roseicitreum antarcticum TaxID=564137 RepID=UPI001CC1F883|nr:hypothetical protein [Roseicitreum antarcticum]
MVNLTHGARCEPADEPIRTITGAHRGEKAVVVPASWVAVAAQRKAGRAAAMNHWPQ